MVDSLFRSWKSAALLAVGVSTLAAAFFADGGGHESFEESAAQIIRNAASWGWDIGTPVAEGQLKIVSRYPERMGLEDLLVSVKREVEEVEPSRLALDGLSATFRYSWLHQDGAAQTGTQLRAYLNYAVRF